MSETAQQQNKFNQSKTKAHLSGSACPVCAAGKLGFFLSNFDRYYFNPERTFDFYKCNACGFTELECERDLETIACFYPTSNYYSYQDQSKNIAIKAALFKLFFRDFGPVMSRLRDIICFPVKQGVRAIRVAPGARLFDIGCGSGKFLRVAKELGMQPYGLEIDPEVCKLARSVTPNIACAFTEEFEGFKTEAGELIKFDVITANHVVEHALDPERFLQCASSWLKPDGILIIGTPNIGSPLVKLFGKYWLGFETPRHLSLFSPSTFSALCERLELEVEKVRYTFDGYSFVFSLLFFIEQKRGKAFSMRLRTKLASFGKLLLFPLCMIMNLLRLGDSVDYYVKQKN